MTVVMVTATGEEHGLLKKISNSVPPSDYGHMSPENKEKVLKMKKEDGKIVKARYINHRGVHERLDKNYCRYAGEPIQCWHFIPNNVYDVPLGLVNEINKTFLTKRSQVDEHNTPVGKTEGKEIIHEFVPISF